MTWKKISEETPPHGEKFDIWVVTKGKPDMPGQRIADVMWARRMGGAYVLHGQQNILSPALAATHWMRKPEPPPTEETLYVHANHEPELPRTAKSPAAPVPAEGEKSEDGTVARPGYF